MMTKNSARFVFFIATTLVPSRFRNFIHQDSENNTILMLLADFKPPPPNPYAPGPSQVDLMGAALRMARLYYERYPWILDWSNMQGKTALHMAALKGNEELVRVSHPET
jgi:hypothetical protein